MNKKKYLKGTLPTVFASVEKENLKKIILIERRETLFLSFRILMKIWDFQQNYLGLDEKLIFSAKVSIPQKNVHIHYIHFCP